MFDLFLTEPFVPFTLALALLFGLLALELVLVFLGATLFGTGSGAEVDLDAQFDAVELGDLDIDFGDADPSLFDLADPELDADIEIETPMGETVSPGPASWLASNFFTRISRAC